jgi:hypothetical protein
MVDDGEKAMYIKATCTIMKTTTLHVWLKLVRLSTLPQMSCHCESWLKSGKCIPTSSINAHTLFTLKTNLSFTTNKSLTISPKWLNV